jgi:hypothetical protein
VAFDETIQRAPATRNDVGGVAVNATYGLHSLKIAIRKIAEKADVDVSDELKAAQDAIDLLFKMFEQNTGYVANDD